VSDSVALAKQVGRDARRIGDAVRPPCREPLPGAAERLERVQAWNEVVLNRSVACTKCGAELARGGRTFMGVGPGANDDDGQAGAWLCAAAVSSLAPEPETPREPEPAGDDRHRGAEED
jgi:hypothetical protein